MKVFGPTDERSREQLRRCIRGAEVQGEVLDWGVLCADHHPGYSMPIGGVLATERYIPPAGIGFDIACGNCAARTNVQAEDVDIANVMDEIASVISFGVGRKNAEDVGDQDVFDAIDRSPVHEQRAMLELARDQFGTVGSGNHYVDLLRDAADGRLWVGVHFGSRGFGHKTATGFLSIAAGQAWGDRVKDGGMDSAPLWLDTQAPSGQDYIAAMEIAGQYAFEARTWVVFRVLEILGARHDRWVHNHHNFAWRESHHGTEVWVIRKGATPAFPGQEGFVGASMGEPAVILRGVDSPESRSGLYSTVHGAGRVMSRTEAAGKMVRGRVWSCLNRDCHVTVPCEKKPDGTQPNPRCPTCDSRMQARKVGFGTRDGKGKVDWPAAQRRLATQGIELRGAGADEAPEAYKRLSEVLTHHQGTVEILHTLHPIGVAMAGAGEFDPYKD